MYTIEVDFEVFKELTLRRPREEVSYNDVIRELLGLSPAQRKDIAPLREALVDALACAPSATEGWTTKGVSFPPGTEFRAVYKGETYHARVEEGRLVLDGKGYDSASAAAMAITGGSPVNGWRFWECRLPGHQDWQLIDSLRPRSHRRRYGR
ncbi:MAG: DUF2924 domain-containing protein [Gammaproteobacteria bacterium]|nr:MAG: DUF2924 domain-containing protein [Gammaproteobacteria bacterium]